MESGLKRGDNRGQGEPVARRLTGAGATEALRREEDDEERRGAQEEEAPVRPTRWERACGWLSVLLPLVVYVGWTRQEFTFGDGPELLTAILTAGGAHPSGYPLFTLLGMPLAHLPVFTPYFNVVVGLSALTSALTSGLLYASLRRLGAAAPWSLVGAMTYAFNDTVLYHSTRLEVYALHCLLVACALYAMIRFSLRPDRPRWAYAMVLAVCLALGNHLTSALLIPAVLVALVLLGSQAERRLGVLRPVPVLVMAAIAAACSLVYLYLPLHALANEGDTISWNDPHTWERFWYHVRGAEYEGYRKLDRWRIGAQRFVLAWSQHIFPGVWLLVALGLFEGLRRRWRLWVPVLLYGLGLLAYIATYDINDISTYYPALYVVVTLALGLGAHWLLEARAPVGSRRARAAFVALVLAALMGWMINTWVLSQGLRYQEALAQDMSEAVVAALPEDAVLFTATDGHTFPMWYQNYVEHPDRSLVTVDLTTRSKRWYRDHLKERYPNLRWPSDEIFRSPGFVPWFIRHNRDRHSFWSLQAKPWKYSGSLTVNRGWLHEVIPTDEARRRGIAQGTRYTKHIYMSHYQRLNNRHLFYDAQTRFPVGAEGLACVVEWWDEHDPIRPQWIFTGPDGRRHEVDVHPVPTASNISWDFLPVEEQVPGPWTCEVKLAGETTLKVAFELVEAR